VCLCKWHDPLIEFGIISFTDDYEILKKPQNSNMLNRILELTTVFQEPIAMPPNPEYLAIHRKRSGFN
jgi:predicted restriction endonuclease